VKLLVRALLAIFEATLRTKLVVVEYSPGGHAVGLWRVTCEIPEPEYLVELSQCRKEARL